jgi:hypothetical protein
MSKQNWRDLQVLRWLRENVNTYVLFALLVFSIFLIPVFDPYSTGWFHQAALMAIYLLVVLNIPRYWWVAFWVALAAIVFKRIAQTGDRQLLEALADLLSLLLFAYGIWGLIRTIVLEKNVNLEVILSAISGYLLLGLFFSVMVGGCVEYDPTAFNFQGIPPSQGDIRYFSFVTLSTLGYGDITPQTPAARSLAIFIAVGGQMYMAVVIALLVGKAGQANGAKTTE